MAPRASGDVARNGQTQAGTAGTAGLAAARGRALRRVLDLYGDAEPWRSARNRMRVIGVSRSCDIAVSTGVRSWMNRANRLCLVNEGARGLREFAGHTNVCLFI